MSVIVKALLLSLIITVPAATFFGDEHGGPREYKETETIVTGLIHNVVTCPGH